MTELKPCPFCGGKDSDLVQTFTRATDQSFWWAVECEKCEAEVVSYYSKEFADKKWNTRTPSPVAGNVGVSDDAQRSALRDMLEGLRFIEWHSPYGGQAYTKARSLIASYATSLEEQK